MIDYDKFTLDNGLRVIVHKDITTPLVAINLLYAVGSKDENEERTGFAHLFEHLMFGGSKHYPNFDSIVEERGGELNAFTCNDYTNYYISLPLSELEIGLKLESDRMVNLIMSQKSLDTQKNVVIEEYKQRYLNQPYGDIWLLLRELAYTKHPYKWNTIGKDISHIENANLDDVKAFYNKFYMPNNAILCIAGNVETESVKALCEKHFGNIERGKEIQRNKTKEPIQTKAREKRVERDVPQSVIFIAYPMSSRLEKEYHAFDLLSDLLSSGRSSRLYNSLVKEKQIFTEVNAFITGDADNGLFVLTGKYRDEVSMQEGREALLEELRKVTFEEISEYEFQKVKNKYESTETFSQIKALERAMNLCYFEFLGDIEQINKEVDSYQSLSIEHIQNIAKETFVEEKSNTLYYEAKI
ncbi:MAG: pitrilysin family protein [Bacteroidales bacterium]|nr:pitrilysin family protein [Bacteroidales bacterium]MDD4683938.1 pitrilysin family protein [Bacteroidales bacterium]